MGWTMSVFSSICMDHDDKFDVAWSFIGDEFRVAIDDDEDNRSLIMFLTEQETEHLIDVLQEALKRAKR